MYDGSCGLQGAGVSRFGMVYKPSCCLHALCACGNAVIRWTELQYMCAWPPIYNCKQHKCNEATETAHTNTHTCASGMPTLQYMVCMALDIQMYTAYIQRGNESSARNHAHNAAYAAPLLPAIGAACCCWPGLLPYIKRAFFFADTLGVFLPSATFSWRVPRTMCSGFRHAVLLHTWRSTSAPAGCGPCTISHTKACAYC